MQKILVSAGHENAIDHIEELALSTEQKHKLPLKISCENGFISYNLTMRRAGKIPVDVSYVHVFCWLVFSHQT